MKQNEWTEFSIFGEERANELEQESESESQSEGGQAKRSNRGQEETDGERGNQHINKQGLVGHGKVCYHYPRLEF